MKDLIIPFAILVVALFIANFDSDINGNTERGSFAEVKQQTYDKWKFNRGGRIGGGNPGIVHSSANLSIRDEVLTHVITPCYRRLASASRLKDHMAQSDVEALLLAGTYESSREATNSIVKAAKGMSAKERQKLYKRKLEQCVR